MLISNYELVEKISETAHAAVWKAHHKKDRDRPLVLKILKTVNLSEYKRGQFRQKIEHLRVLNDPMVITPVSFAAQDDVCFITQDFYDGVSLDKLTTVASRLPLGDFFTIACHSRPN